MRSRRSGTSIVQACRLAPDRRGERDEYGDAHVGGALGGQLTATFLAAHTHNGEPTVTGFTISFVMSTCFLIVCAFVSLLVPDTRPARRALAGLEDAPATD